MSDVENAQTGAIAAPAENTATPQEQTQATPQESANAETDEQKDEQARDEKGRFVQKRINELTRQRYDALRERDQLRQEYERLQAEVSQYRNPAPDPNLDPHAYVQHLAREEARSLIEGERRSMAQQQEQQRFNSIAAEYGSREASYAESHPDYHEAAEAFVSIAGSNPQLAEVLMTSEHGPAVVHYLGQHLDEAVRIAQLPPHLAAVQVARIESRVSAPKPKPVTNAPSPVPTIGGGAASPAKDPDRMTPDEWLAWRRSQL